MIKYSPVIRFARLIFARGKACFAYPIFIAYFSLVKKVGCYYSKGYIDGKRTFPVVKNLRDHIVWTEWERTLKELILLCSAFARENNYEVHD